MSKRRFRVEIVSGHGVVEIDDAALEVADDEWRVSL